MISKTLTHTLAVVSGAALAVVVVQAIDWYLPSRASGALAAAKDAYNARPAPYVAPEPKVVKPVERVVIQPKIVALKPNKREVKKIEKKLGAALPPGKLLSVNEIGELCNGGTAVVTLVPVEQPTGADPDAKGVVVSPEEVLKPVVTVYPNRRPFLGWKWERTLGISYGLGTGALTGSIWNAEFEQSVVRIGSATIGVRAGAFVGPFGHFGYVSAGARFRF